MRNPFRRHCPACGWPNTTPDPAAHAFDCAWIARARRLTSDERYAVTDANGKVLGHVHGDSMPADWPAFAADLFEQEPRQWRDHTAREWAALTEPPVIDAWEHVDAVLAKPAVDDTVRDYEWGADGGAEHPAVIDLRRALDPLEAHEALMRARAQEDIAYAEGRAVRALGLGDIGALFDAEQHMDNREHGARLAALVLAGYTGTPRELVR